MPVEEVSPKRNRGIDEPDKLVSRLRIGPTIKKSSRHAWLPAARISPAVWLWAIALVVVCVVVWLKPSAKSVYSIYAYAGRGWTEGRDAYVLPPHSPVVDNYRYSPLVAMFFAVLYQLPERIGGILWRALGAGLVIGGFGYACRVFDDGNVRTDRQRQWLWLLMLPLCVANLNNGQANLHVVGFFLIGVAAVVESRWNLGAIVLTLSCLVKVYPIALVALLVALYPRPLSWRFALATMIGLALPFLGQSTSFVLEEYRLWAQVLLGDNRISLENGTTYRDLSLLLFRAGLPISRSSFLVIQVALGMAAAATCLFAQRRLHWDSRRLVFLAYGLGTFWMLLCGPCTESSTYVLIAPVAAWLVVGAFSDSARWDFAKSLIVVGAALVHLALFSSMFPFFQTVHRLGVHPLGALIMFVGFVIAEFGDGNADSTVGKAPQAALELKG